MKKLIITVFALCLFFTNIKGQENAIVYLRDNYLEATATNKLDADTIFVDFTKFYNFVVGDSAKLILSLDSTIGYGARASDSTGLPAVQVRIIPYYEIRSISRMIHSGYGMISSVDTSYILDTLNTGGKILEDSVLVFGDAVQYGFVLDYPMYQFIVEYNFADTSAISPACKIEYNVGIYIKAD